MKKRGGEHMDRRFEETVPVLRSLISIKSPYFEEDEIAEHIARWLKLGGVPAKITEYHESKVTNIRGKNVVCEIDGGTPGPKIYLNGHMDTVPLCGGWSRDPFAGEIEGGKIFGLGALDMKSGCAAIMVALKYFLTDNESFSGSIAASFVSDEEGPLGLGTDAVLNSRVADGADVCLVTEPSSGFTDASFPCVCLGAKGGYGIAVEFFGKSAHAATPELGLSAAVEAAKAVAFLEAVKLKTDDVLGASRLCLVKFSSDGGTCSVPDYARIDLYRHTVRGETRETIRRELEDALVTAGVKCGWKISFRETPTEETSSFKPYVTSRDDPYVDKFFGSVKRVSGKDASVTYFPSIGDYNYIAERLPAPCVIFGADGKNFHSADEYADIASVIGTAAVLYDYLTELLTGGHPPIITG